MTSDQFMEKLWHVCKNVALYYFHYACCMMNVSIQILFSSNKEVKKKKKKIDSSSFKGCGKMARRYWGKYFG